MQSWRGTIGQPINTSACLAAWGVEVRVQASNGLSLPISNSKYSHPYLELPSSTPPTHPEQLLKVSVYLPGAFVPNGLWLDQSPPLSPSVSFNLNPTCLLTCVAGFSVTANTYLNFYCRLCTVYLIGTASLDAHSNPVMVFIIIHRREMSRSGNRGVQREDNFPSVHTN